MVPAPARPADPSYTTCHAYRLRGPLDPARLARAFETAAARQESLRTPVPHRGGRGAAPGRCRSRRSRRPDVDEAAEIVRTLSNTAMDLSQPPIKVVLIRLGRR